MKKAITILEVFLNTNIIIKVALRTSLRLFVHFYLERFELGTKFNNDIFFLAQNKILSVFMNLQKIKKVRINQSTSYILMMHSDHGTCLWLECWIIVCINSFCVYKNK